MGVGVGGSGWVVDRTRLTCQASDSPVTSHAIDPDLPTVLTLVLVCLMSPLTAHRTAEVGGLGLLSATVLWISQRCPRSDEGLKECPKVFYLSRHRVNIGHDGSGVPSRPLAGGDEDDRLLSDVNGSDTKALCARLVIAGCGADVGKTTIAIGIMAALAREVVVLPPRRWGPTTSTRDITASPPVGRVEIWTFTSLGVDMVPVWRHVPAREPTSLSLRVRWGSSTAWAQG